MEINKSVERWKVDFCWPSRTTQPTCLPPRRIIKDSPLKTSCLPFVTLVVGVDDGCIRASARYSHNFYLSLAARAPWISAQTLPQWPCLVCALQKLESGIIRNYLSLNFHFTLLASLGYAFFTNNFEEHNIQNTQLTLPHLALLLRFFLNFQISNFWLLRLLRTFPFSIFLSILFFLACWRALALLTRL